MCIHFSFASKASFRAVKSQNCERQGVSKFVWKDGLQLQFFSQKADPTVYFLAHLVRLSLYSLIFWPPGGKILTSGEALEEVHALTEQIIEPGIRLTVEGIPLTEQNLMPGIRLTVEGIPLTEQILEPGIRLTVEGIPLTIVGHNFR